ncbi:MAG: hypothetical protein KF693_17330 [Nitrospira sp.]|nr:hypothetical protein [Nitrospira sp.]
MTSKTSFSKHDLLFLISLLLLEASIVVILQALHIKGETSFDVFLPRLSGMVFLCASGAFLVSGAVIVRRYLEHRRSPSHSFLLVVAMNIITVVLTVVTAEIAVRAAVRSYYGYEAIGTLVLKPKNWNAIKGHYQKLIRKQRGDLSYHVYDPLLGWTVGPSRLSADGLYWSSPEGIRAPDGNTSFARNTEGVDIALVGDSFTFGEEVPYKESYGYHLEQMLGAPFRVLNFGVPGYGLAQMFLRYERDVRPWKPKVSIFGFISSDLRRTLWVYPFLGDFRWGNPYSNPRFILSEGELTTINTTLLTSDVIFSRESISELPFLEYQREYHPREWERHFYHASYLVRLLLSWYSSWPDDRDEVSEEALLSINAALVKAFVTSATHDGSIPLLVYLPVESELNRPSRRPAAKQVLEEVGIAYVDPTSCLLEVNPSDRFSRHNGHYASQGNAAIAKCLLPVIHQAVTGVHVSSVGIKNKER